VLPVPVSFDFGIAATRYFHGLEQGELPLLLLFSGNIFYLDAEGSLAMGPIDWCGEIQARVPLGVWRALRDEYYPDLTWLGVRRATFEALDAYKRSLGVTGYDEALQRLLPEAPSTAVVQ
jgi:Family of unknown function (DUF6084)